MSNKRLCATVSVAAIAISCIDHASLTAEICAPVKRKFAFRGGSKKKGGKTKYKRT